MSRIYDKWERLVGATLKREEFRELARAPSLSSTSSDFSSRFSSPIHDYVTLNPEASRILSKSVNSSASSSPSISSAEKLGSGMTVAIKRWNRNVFQGCKGWLTEVNYLSHFHHPNLIKLIAYCTEGHNLLLVYEFMPKGSLYNHLFGRGNQCLSWSTRIRVAVNTAKGLSFLHDAKNQVIHRNFKSVNILLDEDFNAKLSDFGLVRNGPPDDRTHVTTLIMGTHGYAAPEYIATGHLTKKCDVYGFGVVLLELLSGRRVIDRSTSKEQFLVDWARPYLSKEKEVHRVVDTKLKGQYPLEGAVIVSNLALKCLSGNPKSRPYMSEVLATLEQL